MGCCQDLGKEKKIVQDALIIKGMQTAQGIYVQKKRNHALIPPLFHIAQKTKQKVLMSEREKRNDSF